MVSKRLLAWCRTAANTHERKDRYCEPQRTIANHSELRPDHASYLELQQQVLLNKIYITFSSLWGKVSYTYSDSLPNAH